MAEVSSRQVTAIAGSATSPGKLLPSSNGKVKAATITSPASVTWANGDTIGSGVVIPAGARFLASSFVSCAAMGASVVLAVGTRDPVTKTAISASGIATGVSVAAATQAALNSGALVAAGVESITTAACEVYATLSGATPTANAQIRIEVHYLTND